MEQNLHIIARIHSDFSEKFGIPRQSGLVEDLTAAVVFEPQYANANTVRGLEGFSHIWLIWQFSEAVRKSWSPTVRPPRLGGNERMGVFATRSPFRPNPLGLSCVRLDDVELSASGPVLHVSGADLLDGTPIYDIKPYLPYTDAKPDAVGGFTDSIDDYLLEVYDPETLLKKLPYDKQHAAAGVLSHDPRPSYQNDAERVYGMSFAGFDIRFTVEENRLTVLSVQPNMKTGG